MAKIQYSQAAKHDLEQIGENIAMELESPIAACSRVTVSFGVKVVAKVPSIIPIKTL